MNFCTVCGARLMGPYCQSCGAAAASITSPPVQEIFHTETPQIKRRPNKKVILAATSSFLVLGLASAFLIREFVLPVTGPVEVIITNDSTTENPVNSRFLELSLSGESISIPGSGKTEVLEQFTWSTSSPLVFSIDSKIRLENDQNWEIDLGELGLNGSDSGVTITVEILINNDRVNAAIESTELFSSNSIIRRATFQRVNLNQAVTACARAEENNYLTAVGLTQSAYSNYVAALEDRQLDGERSLYYSTWASRSNRLIEDLDAIVVALDSAPTPNSGPIGESHRDVKAALLVLQDSWEYFNSVARSESDADWDGAWEDIFNAESALSYATGDASTITSKLESECRDSLLEG